MLGLCARRSTVRRAGAAGGDVLLLARPARRSSAGAPGRLCRDLPGRRFWRIHQALWANRKPGPLVEAACWVHARRPFFVMADVAAAARRKAEGRTTGVISPLALEAVRRIDALFEIERTINGESAERRRAVRQELSAPLVTDLERWLREQRRKLSRGNDLAKAMDYMLKRWPAFSQFLDDGRICLSNNAAERALRGIALGRKSWLFAGSDRGGQRAAAIYSLIVTAKL